MEQAKARCRMRMAAMVALPAKMQMEMANQAAQTGKIASEIDQTNIQELMKNSGLV